jgi:hypothetical protein
VWVCPTPRYCDRTAGSASDPEKPMRGVGVDDGVARHIPL